MIRLMIITLSIFLLNGCASLHYAQTDIGVLKGKLEVEWIEPDQFIFRPDKDNPLTFIRKNNDTITPGTMYTDGGSIPRPLWALHNFSPWGYAPAFIVHDWLFDMKHCKKTGNERYTLEEAAWIMSEVMKTMMQKIGVDKLALYAMFEAVRSPIAADLWEHGKCVQPEYINFDSTTKQNIHYIIEFP